MITDIFIKTYSKDIQWLAHCLRSITYHCRGFRRVVLVVPENEAKLYDRFSVGKLVAAREHGIGYLWQQVCKLQADKYCEDAEAVLYVDSDCVFVRECTPESFCQNDKPIVYMTPWDRVGAARCWKEPTEKAMKETVNWEYMRRLPCLFFTRTLRDAAEWFVQNHPKPINEYVVSQPGRHFSEFNFLGAWAHRHHPELYQFVNTEEVTMPPVFAKQFRSWDGITYLTRRELEKIEQNSKARLHQTR